MDQVKIGKLIKKRRKEKKLTQQELADLLNLSCKTISKWECGNGCPDISILKELSQILGISVTDLLNGEENSEEKADSLIIDSLSYYNKKTKKKFLLFLGMTLLILLPLIILTAGESNRFKNLPSFTTIALKNQTTKLAQALTNYDYSALKKLLGSNNIYLPFSKEKGYTKKELITRVENLKTRGVKFENFSYENSSYGEIVYYNVSVIYKNTTYDLRYKMEYDAASKKYVFHIWAPTHDSDKEVYKLIENVFCPGSDYFEI